MYQKKPLATTRDEVRTMQTMIPEFELENYEEMLEVTMKAVYEGLTEAEEIMANVIM